jgi:hypothetical protein
MWNDNARTRLTHLQHARDFKGFRLSPTDWSEVMLKLAQEREGWADRTVLGVVAVQEDSVGLGFQARVLPAPEGGGPVAVVLGRHGECPVQLPDASLRHAAVMAWPGQDGAPPVVEVLDLNSGSHVRSVDGVQVARVAGTCCVGVTVGSATVFGLLAQPGRPFQRDEPSLEVTAVSGTPLLAEHDVQRLAPRRAPPPTQRSFVSYLHRLVQRGEAGAPLGWASPEPLGFLAPDGAVRDLAGHILHPGAWEVVSLPESAYRRGVLLGRYARCTRHTLLDADGGVSRVHALVLMRRERLWVLDTASTNGTWVRTAGGEVLGLTPRNPIRHLDDDDQVSLGSCTLRFQVE